MSPKALTNFWKFLNTDVRSLPWSDISEQGINAVVSFGEAGSTFNEQASKISQFQNIASNVEPFLNILDSPVTQLALSGLPILSVGIGLLRLYRGITENESSPVQIATLTIQLAYLQSLRDILKSTSNTALNEQLPNFSCASLLKRQSEKLEDLTLTTAKVENAIANFRASEISGILDEVIREEFDEFASENKNRLLIERVRWGTHRFIHQAILELGDDAKILTSFFSAGGQETCQKYSAIESYLETEIREQPHQKIFDEEHPLITLEDLYVQLSICLIDEEGNTFGSSQPTNIHEWFENFLESKFTEPFLKSDKPQVSRVLLIEGDAGQGKTIFCKMFAHAVLAKIYPSFTPILIRVRDLSFLGRNLTETLKFHLENLHFVQAYPGWITDKNIRYLFIFDGFDELLVNNPNAGDIARFLKQISVFQRSSHHQCMITGRPIALINVKQLRGFQRLRLQPMSDTLQKEWLTKWSNKVGEKEGQDFENFLDLCPRSIQDGLAREPLLLYLLARLHREKQLSAQLFEDSRGIQAKTRIYNEAIKWVLSRQREDENFRLSGLSLDDLRKVLQEVAVCIVQSRNEVIKLSLLENRLLSLDSPVAEQIDQSAEETGQDKLQTLNSLLTTFYLRPGEVDRLGQVEFTHRSFGEFLFAEKLASDLENLCNKTEGKDLEEFKYEAIQQIYENLGYGGLTLEIVEYLVTLLFENSNTRIENIFNQLRRFYEDWCFGEYIDYPPNNSFLQIQMKRLESMEVELGLRQIDIYAGLNIMILLFKLSSSSRKSNRHLNLNFHPCFLLDHNDFDYSRLFKVVGYSHCMGLYKINPSSISSIAPEDFSSKFFVNLVGQFLDGANLSGIYLAGLNFSRANLSEADLSGANLDNINLDNANLSEGNLKGASLNKADLSGVNLSGANLEEASLRDAKLREADLSDTHCKGADITESDLSSSDLSEANFENSNLRRSDFSHSDLRSSTFFEADLAYSDLSSADLSDADLRYADIREADLSKTDLRNSKLNNAYVAGSSLQGAVVRSADLSETVFKESDLRGADLRASKAISADFTGADLRQADLQGADLRKALLTKAKLDRAELKNSNIAGADLRDISFNKKTSWEEAEGKEKAKNLPEDWRSQIQPKL